jgi:hypothetical protein
MVEQTFNGDQAREMLKRVSKKSKAFVDFLETSGDINISFRKFS